MKITKKTNLVAILFIFLLILCLTARLKNDVHTETVLGAMDTVSKITVISKSDAKSLVSECKNIINRYDELFSISKPKSDFYKINNLSQTVVVSQDTIDIVSKCEEFYNLSEKRFDITGGTLYKLWSDAIKNEQLPEDNTIKEAMEYTGFNTLLIERNNSAITKKQPQQQLNAGAVAKGYITDKINEYLKTTNASGALVDLGGNILAYGKKNNKTPWNIGISTPKNDGKILLSLSLSDKFVITSGNYQRYFDVNSTRYHHIIDATTGYPAKSELKSVTIICDNGFLGDALSTVCFLSGLTKGIEIAKIYGVSAVFVTDTNTVFYSGDILPIMDNKNPDYSFCEF